MTETRARARGRGGTGAGPMGVTAVAEHDPGRNRRAHHGRTGSKAGDAPSGRLRRDAAPCCVRVDFSRGAAASIESGWYSPLRANFLLAIGRRSWCSCTRKLELAQQVLLRVEVDVGSAQCPCNLGWLEVWPRIRRPRLSTVGHRVAVTLAPDRLAGRLCNPERLRRNGALQSRLRRGGGNGPAMEWCSAVSEQNSLPADEVLFRHGTLTLPGIGLSVGRPGKGQNPCFSVAGTPTRPYIRQARSGRMVTPAAPKMAARKNPAVPYRPRRIQHDHCPVEPSPIPSGRCASAACVSGMTRSNLWGLILALDGRREPLGRSGWLIAGRPIIGECWW